MKMECFVVGMELVYMCNMNTKVIYINRYIQSKEFLKASYNVIFRSGFAGGLIGLCSILA